MIDKPHDSLVKAIFAKLEHAAELFRTGLPADVAERIDFGGLEARSANFIDEFLHDSATDLLFLAPYREQPILLLLEHLSTVQPHAILRAWRYTGRAWSDHLAKNRGASRPPVLIPYVLHHSDKAWSAPTSMRAYFGREAAGSEPLDAFVPGFRFVLDDLSARSDTELRGRDMSAVPKLTLWALKTARDPEALKATIHGWAEVFRAALESWDELLLILRYTVDVCEVEAEYIRTFLAREVGPRAEEAYMTIGQALRAEGRSEGRSEGRIEGRSEGRIEGRIEALRAALTKLVQQRFGDLPADTALRIQQADSESLERWIERVIPAASLADIFAD